MICASLRPILNAVREKLDAKELGSKYRPTYKHMQNAMLYVPHCSEGRKKDLTTQGLWTTIFLLDTNKAMQAQLSEPDQLVNSFTFIIFLSYVLALSVSWFRRFNL